MVKHSFNLRLDPALDKRLSHAAVDAGESKTAFVARAIDEALKRQIRAQLRMGRITQAEHDRQLAVLEMTIDEARAAILRAERPIDHDLDLRQQHR